MANIAALVVTYNRKELLQECIDAILSQSLLPNKILVFNNNSTDGTEKLFDHGSKYDIEKIELINSNKNLGGAGGFSEGIKYLSKTNCDWIWIMDDDTIPERTALEQLLSSAEYLLFKGERPSFLASCVQGANNEPMNVPTICYDLNENGYSYWYKYLDKGMVSIDRATFVSLMISNTAVKKVGFPTAEYFIWGDDIEYTRRLVTFYGPAYFCGTSKVIHKRYNVKKLSIINEEEKTRLPMYWYYYRNNLLTIEKYDGNLSTFRQWILYFGLSFYCLINPKIKYRITKFKTVQKGIWMYISYSFKKQK